MTEEALYKDSASKLAIKEDFVLTDAQSILVAMGLKPFVLFAHHKEPSLSYTKKGPGRKPAHKK